MFIYKRNKYFVAGPANSLVRKTAKSLEPEHGRVKESETESDIDAVKPTGGIILDRVLVDRSEAVLSIDLSRFHGLLLGKLEDQGVCEAVVVAATDRLD